MKLKAPSHVELRGEETRRVLELIPGEAVSPPALLHLHVVLDGQAVVLLLRDLVDHVSQLVAADLDQRHVDHLGGLQEFLRQVGPLLVGHGGLLLLHEGGAGNGLLELEGSEHLGLIRGIFVLFVVKLGLALDKREQVSEIGGKVLSVLLEELVLEGGLEVVMLHLVEAIHVELPHKAVHFLMPEIAREHDLLELHDILDHELVAIERPVDNLLILLDLYHIGKYAQQLECLEHETSHLVLLTLLALGLTLRLSKHT